MTSLHEPRSSFVIRIWWEAGRPPSDGQPTWRAWVQHARSGDAAYVQNVEGLLAFIERRVGKLSALDRLPMGLK